MAEGRAGDVSDVRVDVYRAAALPLPALAERLAAMLRLPLAHLTGPIRGPYFRWSGDNGADLLVQANVLDDEGLPVESKAPAGAPLVYATGLPEHVHAALAGTAALTLVSTEVVTVPTVPSLPNPILTVPAGRVPTGSR